MAQTAAHLIDIVAHNLATNPTEKEARDSIFLLQRALQLIETELYEEGVSK